MKICCWGCSWLSLVMSTTSATLPEELTESQHHAVVPEDPTLFLVSVGTTCMWYTYNQAEQTPIHKDGKYNQTSKNYEAESMN